MSKKLYTTVLIALISLLVLGMIPTAEAVEGEDSYLVDVWVRDRSGTGLNNATVTLKESGDKMGGADVTSGTTTTYYPVVDNESIGTGDGTEDTYYVTGLPLVDWNGDDTIDDYDVLVYVDGTKQTPLVKFNLTKTTGKIVFYSVYVPANGKPITVTYKWNAGPGHVRFTNVEAGNYVVVGSKSGYISEYDDISVTSDGVYTITLNKWGEVGHAIKNGNPLAMIGIGIGTLVGLAAYAKHIQAV